MRRHLVAILAVLVAAPAAAATPPQLTPAVLRTVAPGEISTLGRCTFTTVVRGATAALFPVDPTTLRVFTRGATIWISAATRAEEGATRSRAEPAPPAGPRASSACCSRSGGSARA